MKLKFPKKITIGDRIFKVKTDKKEGGGNFSYANHEIIIGTKHLKKQPQSVLNVIIHELMEIICIEEDTRLDKGNNYSDYVFVYDHQQHTDIVRRLAGILNEFIK
jgi:hypothetical protein